MNHHHLHAGEVTAAALLIGGVVAIVFPGYALSIVQVVILTVAAAVALHALGVSVPPTGWMSPFRWMSPFGQAVGRERPGEGPDDLDSIASKLSGWRQPIQHGPPLPPEILRLLKPLIRAALNLERNGEAPSTHARARLSPRTWAALTHDPPKQSHWFRALPPNPRDVAEVVHAILDELEGIAAGSGESDASLDTLTQRET